MPDEIRVRQFMTAPAMALPCTASLLDAALTFRRTGFRHLPIVDGERLVGIVTDRDVSRFAPSLLRPISQDDYNSLFESTPLDRVMTRNPTTVTPDTSVRDAVAILHKKKLGCLPVVEDGRLLGILTVTDVLGLLHRLLGGKEQPASVLDQV